MSTATTTTTRKRKKRDNFDYWWKGSPGQGKSLVEAIRVLWDAAARRPDDGLSKAWICGRLVDLHPGAVACALRRAEARGHLVRVRRLTIDEAGNVAGEWRYQAMGTRP